MLNNRLNFECVIKFTRCCAELTRQGIAFNGGESSTGFYVFLTGH